MRRTILACIVALTCLSGCDRGRTDRAAAPASLGEQIERVFQARLPQSVGEVQVESVVLMTRVVYGTFTCSRSDLADFLASSRLLPDGLTAGVNPAAPVNSPLPWWQPQTLSDPAGNECYWEDGEDVASGLLSAGWSGSDDATVYFMAVYENKRQSGLRPDVKADPNWGK